MGKKYCFVLTNNEYENETVMLDRSKIVIQNYL